MRMPPSCSSRFVCTLALTVLLAALVGCGDDSPADADGGAIDAAAIDASASDASASCSGTELRCGSGCVDVQADPAHCGGCDAACATGEMCEAGECVSSCSGTLTECDGACVDTRSSTEHCGACDAECELLAGAVPACLASECVVACLGGYGDCNAVDEDGCEAQLANDDANCGACANVCAAGPCRDGACTVTSLYALGTSPPGLPGSVRQAVVEIRELVSGALTRSIALPGAAAWSLAVAPDGLEVYVATGNDEVLVIDVAAEAITTRVPIPRVRDLVLSADGASLYAAGADLHRIDTATAAITTLTVPGQAFGIALSPDGATLGAAGWDSTSATAALLHLVDTATFAEARVVPLVGSVAGCGTQPADVKITTGGRALVWDSNCDALYQVDVATGTQLAGATVATGRDSGSFGFASNSLVYDEATARAYVSNESGRLLVIDPVAVSFTARTDVGATPMILAPTPDRAALYVVNSMQPTVLGRVTMADGSFTPSVLTLAHTLLTPDVVVIVAR